jgi:hypothetical protein
MRAKIAAGQATKFPGGRKPGAHCVTKRMWDARCSPSSKSFAASWTLALAFRQGRRLRKRLFIELLHVIRTRLP